MYEVDPRVGVARLTTLDALLAQRLRARQFLVMLLGVFAVVAVAVAVVGVYGVMSQTVIEREREIGLRMALGADASTVIRQFLGEAAWMTMTGLVAGLLIAGAATRALLGLLYGVSPLDPTSVSMACLVVTLLALIAAVVPAWRAVRVSPAHALQVP
jgi:ABC-type antimicrobial peptide transport system permease subunit